MKRVLFVASISPFNKGGGAQATMCYLDAVLDLFGSNNVDILIDDLALIPKEYTSLHFIKIPIRTRIKRITEYFDKILSRFTKPLMAYVKDNWYKYDICVINGGLAAGKAVAYLNKFNIKTVVIHFDYSVEYHKDNKTIESLYGYYLKTISDVEGYAYKNADINLFLTKQDMELFKINYGTPKGYVRLLGCFDLKNAEVVSLNNEKKTFDAVISGSLATYQTTVGIKDFHDNYLKIAEDLIPNIQILLTGRDPSPEITRILKEKPDTYTIVPNPKEIIPVVQNGNIYICPTCIGGGLKLRAMDGLKCGLPILIHEVSARGYDFYYNKPYFKVYKDKATFKNGLSQILDYLSSNSDISRQINQEYYDFFGYDSGLQRMKYALS